MEEIKLSHKFTVDSKRGKTLKYLVKIYSDGHATCECLYYQYTGFRKGLGECEHIERALNHIKNKKNEN